MDHSLSSLCLCASVPSELAKSKASQLRLLGERACKLPVLARFMPPGIGGRCWMREVGLAAPLPGLVLGATGRSSNGSSTGS